VALRIPRCSGQAMRVEHRVAGACANPYLVLAGILAGVEHGIANRIDPGPAAEGNAEELGAPSLPTSWNRALELFEKSPFVSQAFGTDFQDVYARLKHTERRNFERIVTPLDHLWYARVA
jgi:glutamine synthetase